MRVHLDTPEEVQELKLLRAELSVAFNDKNRTYLSVNIPGVQERELQGPRQGRCCEEQQHQDPQHHAPLAVFALR